jgi:hypothetical protein
MPRSQSARGSAGFFSAAVSGRDSFWFRPSNGLTDFFLFLFLAATRAKIMTLSLSFRFRPPRDMWGFCSFEFNL